MLDQSKMFKYSYEMRTTLSLLLRYIDLIGFAGNTPDNVPEYLDSMRIAIDDLIKGTDEFMNISLLHDDDLNNDLSEDIILNGFRALVVEDNELNSLIMSKLLNCFGIQADVVKSGEEALVMYNENDYDIIFMDYLLPGMNGLETARQIRETGSKGSEQLIIALTTDERHNLQESFNDIAVEVILLKPVNYRQLCVILKRELMENYASSDKYLNDAMLQ